MKNLQIKPISFMEYIKFSEDIAEIELPDDRSPIAEGNYIKVLNGKYPVEILETSSTAEQLVQLWNQNNQKLPLDELLVSLLQLDFIDYKNQKSPIYPRFIELILLLDSLEKCRNIDNFERRVNKIKKLLKGLLKSSNANLINKLVEIYEKIVSIRNEFYLAYLLNAVEQISFTDDKKADFYLINKKMFIDAKINIKVDTTLNVPTKQLKIDFDNVLMLMIKNGYRQIEHAFNDQGANLVMVNLSMTLIGSLLGGRSHKSHTLRQVFPQATNAVEKGKDGVIFYCIFRGNINNTYFSYMDKTKVLTIGRILDKIELDLIKNSGMTLNTWDLLEIFQNLKDLNKKLNN